MPHEKRISPEDYYIIPICEKVIVVSSNIYGWPKLKYFSGHERHD